MQTIALFLSSLWATICDIFIWLVSGVGWVIGAMFYTALEGVYTVLLAFLTALDFTAIVASWSGLWSSLPGPLTYLVVASGLTQGVTVIVSALGIRLLLNLIPAVFTRV